MNILSANARQQHRARRTFPLTKLQPSSYANNSNMSAPRAFSANEKYTQRNMPKYLRTDKMSE
jgi:hypothetical protein